MITTRDIIDSIELILKPNPDLKPTDITIANSPASGKQISIDYTVLNDGFADKEDEYHKDNILSS